VPAGAVHPGRSGRTYPRRVVARWVRQGIWRPIELACRRSLLVGFRVTVSEPGEPSSANCDAWVLHIRSDDSDDRPVLRELGLLPPRWLLPGRDVGPNQGYFNLVVDAVSPDTALGQGP
jgi:hypothetical protein